MRISKKEKKGKMTSGISPQTQNRCCDLYLLVIAIEDLGKTYSSCIALWYIKIILYYWRQLCIVPCSQQ